MSSPAAERAKRRRHKAAGTRDAEARPKALREAAVEAAKWLEATEHCSWMAQARELRAAIKVRTRPALTLIQGGK